MERMHLSEYQIISKENDEVFLKKETEVDDDTFFMWKMELKKELPNFWEKMNSRF
jgi:hypothetical protein